MTNSILRGLCISCENFLPLYSSRSIHSSHDIPARRTGLIFRLTSLFEFSRRSGKFGILVLVRSQPERYYEFSGDTTDYVGQRGEACLLFFSKIRIYSGTNNDDLERLGVKYQSKTFQTATAENKPKQRFFSSPYRYENTSIDASLRDVGFGISQVLPIVVQSGLSEKKTLLIEQPEIHLHPAHQAELGDLFIRSAKEQGNTLLLETHSEHLLLRIMRRMRETSTGELPEGALAVRPEDVMVLFVESDGSQSIVREMPLNERGELVKAWPGGFFEEGLREIL